MSKTSFLFLLLGSILLITPIKASRPDYAYVFAYSTEKNDGKNGLHYAWSIDRQNWYPIGAEHSFVRSDYGTWGSQKRMLSPVLIPDIDGIWHALWSLNETDGTFAHSSSSDLIFWGRQTYVDIIEDGNCLEPEVSYNQSTGTFTISFISETKSGKKILKTETKRFKEFSPLSEISETERLNNRESVEINGIVENGTIHYTSWEYIEGLINAQKITAYKHQLQSETMSQDPLRFARLQPLEAGLKISVEDAKEISDELIGIFFEDINYAADGGLYAELIQNRGFEYHPSDKKGRDPNWNSKTAWSTQGKNIKFNIDTKDPIHVNNSHYGVVNIKDIGESLINEGFNGIPLQNKASYDFSLFAKKIKGDTGNLIVRLIGDNGEIYDEKNIGPITNNWQQYNTILTSNASTNNARLEIVPQMKGETALDMISLFPQHTFMGRENGLRADLAQTIADMHPKFIRFPGGCLAHGDGLDNMYRWKETIGPLEARKPQRNIWNYHQSYGLGYFEYFQFCSDIGAEPIPVVPAGVPCQNSDTGGRGQQGGIPMCEMYDYVQEVLDLIEWANGDINSEWGKKRAEAGRKEPFNLKYIAVGNEDLITDVFEERFTMIYEAIKHQHPEITVIGTVGPFFEGTDYVEGWDLATRLKLPIVDEHYYASPGWYIHNQDDYDKYDRSKSKVYLGEYAAHLPNRHNNIETALAEALHITTLERNGDIVVMSSYAPLLAKEGNTQWNPDLIYFNNTEVKPTVGYYVQQLCGQNSGNKYIPAVITLSSDREDVRKRFASSVVIDSESNDLIIKLVNLLPVEIKTSIDLKGLDIKKGEAQKFLLQGQPSDRNAKPETGTIMVEENFTYEVPPYSFTILRIKQ